MPTGAPAEHGCQAPIVETAVEAGQKQPLFDFCEQEQRGLGKIAGPTINRQSQLCETTLSSLQGQRAAMSRIHV